MSNTEELRIVVIGAGMSGILWGIKLQEAGFHNFKIYEKNARLGGTWHENTYPGLSCDVPSHLYRYSFEPNPEWSHVFSPGSEICGYFETIARKYGLDRFIAFGKELTECVWKDGQWYLAMKDGQKDVADIVVSASGVLHHPTNSRDRRSRIFQRCLLSQCALGPFSRHRWATRRRDRERALQGSRSSPPLSQRVKKLCLFQRTPQWIMPQKNIPYSEEEKDSFRRDPAALKKMYADLTKSFSEGFRDRIG